MTAPRAALLLASALWSLPAAQAQTAFLSNGPHFEERDGAALYAHVCAACHQADGRGAVGAGTYPKLAGNENLEAAGYPLTVLLHGLRGMPPLGRLMDDDQVVAVVAYVRTHFGNDYRDGLSVEDVKAAR